MRRWLLGGLVALSLGCAGGCAGLAPPGVYPPRDPARECERDGGVWRPYINDGYCEIQAPGFL